MPHSCSITLVIVECHLSSGVSIWAKEPKSTTQAKVRNERLISMLSALSVGGSISGSFLAAPEDDEMIKKLLKFIN